MKRKILLIVVFLFINFGALALGSLLMENGPLTDWYLELDKASWTPPGWVFGFAWTIIMICFSFYMAYLISQKNTTNVKVLFLTQVLLNISWNYIFFNKHQIDLGLITITLLTFLILYFLITYREELKLKSLLIVPYFLWLCIATSLNLYISLYN